MCVSVFIALTLAVVISVIVAMIKEVRTISTNLPAVIYLFQKHY